MSHRQFANRQSRLIWRFHAGILPLTSGSGLTYSPACVSTPIQEPAMEPLIGRSLFVHRFAVAAGAISLAVGLAVLVDRSAAQSPFPAPLQTQTPRIVGRWTGKTQE